MELQDALEILGKLVEDSPITHADPVNALQAVRVELDSMEHRLGAWERQDERHKSEMLKMVNYQQGATRAYERIIEGLAKLLQES